MLVVVSLGGNALLERGQRPSFVVQRANVERAVRSMAELVAAGHRLLVTHGNGPQIGLLALAAQGAGDEAAPLDVLGAETEGAIGYMIEQALRCALPDRSIVTLLTQTVLDPDDPAFARPEKPIGPVYAEAEAERIGRERRWKFAADGRGYRRIVPSPRPRAILETDAIRLLLAHDMIVICGGGGGIPVVRSASGRFEGVEAVVDKDFTSALIAQEIGADRLLLLTDVDGVYQDWGTAVQARLQSLTPSALEQYRFAAGSMGPKVEAACAFVAASGKAAGIGRIDDARAILEGRAGTRISR